MMGKPPDWREEPSDPDPGRYGQLALDGGDVVIYDRDEPESYIQSDTTTPVES